MGRRRTAHAARRAARDRIRRLPPNERLSAALLRETDRRICRCWGDRAIPIAVFGVKREYLDAAFDEMKQRYGTIEKYFADGLGIDSESQAVLRAMFLKE